MNDHLKKHIDNKSIDLIGKLELLNLPKEEKRPVNKNYSLDNRILPGFNIPLSSRKGVINHITEEGKKNGIWFEKEGTRLGFRDTNFIEFQKLIRSIHKDKSIKELADFSFLERTVFDWLIQTKANSRAENNLSDHIEIKLNSAIVEKNFSFLIRNLEISEPIKIGNCNIHFLAEEDVNSILSHSPEKPETEKDELRKMCQGKVVITTNQRGTRDKCLKDAIFECKFAVDILKVCSDTVEYPETLLHFDIEERVSVNKSCLYFTYNADFNDFDGGIYFQGKKAHLDENYLERIRRRSFDILVEWHKNHTNTELNDLLKLAISNFALCLSNSDLHKRIADIFSIYESLLLPNQNSGILESLKKYGSKLIFKESKDRKDLKQLFDELYKVRSSLVHHGKRSNFELHKLKQLQFALLMLFGSLIRLSTQHNQKESILEEIDKAIEEAY